MEGRIGNTNQLYRRFSIKEIRERTGKYNNRNSYSQTHQLVAKVEEKKFQSENISWPFEIDCFVGLWNYQSGNFGSRLCYAGNVVVE